MKKREIHILIIPILILISLINSRHSLEANIEEIRYPKNTTTLKTDKEEKDIILFTQERIANLNIR